MFCHRILILMTGFLLFIQVDAFHDYETTTQCNITLIAETVPKILQYSRTLTGNVSNCWWNIQSGDRGQQVVLDTLQLILYRQRFCDVARVRLYNGSDDSGDLVRAWCGGPKYILQKSSDGFFMTAEPQYYSIFLFKYYQEDVRDGSIQRLAERQTESILESPGFFLLSYGGIDQTYTITADQPGDVIIIEADVFHLKYSVGGPKDTITVSQDGQILGRYMDRRGPYMRADPGKGPVTIRYQTYEESLYSPENGFRIRINAERPSSEPPTIGFSPLRVHGLYNSISVPSSLQLNGNENVTFTWKLKSRDEDIRVTIFYPETRLLCNDSILAIYDGDMWDERLPIQCSVRGPEVQGTKSNMTIALSYTGNFNPADVRVRYYTTRDRYPCGRNYTASTSFQFIKSVGYPNEYDENLNCVYHIDASEGERILITAEGGHVDIEESLFCTHDYALVMDGPSVLSEVMNRVCGQNGVTYTSTSASMTVVFHTNSAVSGQGFRLSFKAVLSNETCRKQSLNVINNPLSIQVPKYRPRGVITANTNQINTECVFVLFAPSDHVVYLEVNTSSLQSPGDCTTGYVEAIDDVNPLGGPSLRKWCGTDDTASALSSGIFMSVVIKQYDVSSISDFKIRYSALPKPITVSGRSNGLSVGIVVGIVIGIVPVVVLIIIGIVCLIQRRSSYRM